MESIENVKAEQLQRILADIQGTSEEAEDVSFLTELIPIENNERVDHFVCRFTGPQKKWIRKSLERSGRYRDRMREIFREEGLPEELVYLALIESGYNPHAYSRSGAVGIWQFMKATGRRYGLVIDWWVDERRDLEKSTRAAALYLKDLYALFEDWHLAAAAYNAGEGKLKRGLDRYRTDNFWKLSKKRYLKKETRNYVPRFLAVLTIARDPRRYGFSELEYETPLLYETVAIRHPMDLAVAAQGCGVGLNHMKKLNPQLHRGCTPPHYRGDYEIKIPRGSRERFVAHCSGLGPEERLTFVRHRIRSGETLSHIANRYGVSIRSITEMNRMKSRHRIREGKSIIVPVPARYADQNGLSKKKWTSAASGSGDKKYRVRKGDSLWSISIRHGVSVDALRRWNRLGTSAKIHPGQRLVVRKPETASTRTRIDAPRSVAAARVSPGPGKGTKVIYRVRKGDSLWKIANRHDVSLASVVRWNGLSASSNIHPGQNLVLWREVRSRETTAVPGAGGNSAPATERMEPSRHTVRQGDTLWEIARKYDISLSDLCLWNNLDTRRPIRPGLRLDIAPQSRLLLENEDLLAEKRPDPATP